MSDMLNKYREQRIKMEQYKKEFIEFLFKNKALKFGEFKLKSGRISPYFINTGMFRDGDGIKQLASYYAKAIDAHFKDFDVLFGPAYKGIPLCVSTVMELSSMGINKGYTFNRKERKDHGEKDLLVGTEITKDTKIIIIDDIITAGTAIRETVALLRQDKNPAIQGIIVSIDRKEKGTTELSAIQEIKKILGVSVVSIVNFDEIKEYAYENGMIDDEMYQKMNDYKEKYGVE